jgi:Fe(3+) dicitrate transport protein
VLTYIDNENRFQQSMHSSSLVNRIPGFLTVALGLCLFALPAFGQSRVLSGVIEDQNGHAISSAAIAVEGLEAKRTFTAATGADGTFAIGDVSAGTYMVTVRAAGFRETAVEVTLPLTTPITIKLNAGQVAAHVMVTASLLAGSPESLSEVPGSVDRLDADTLAASRVFNFSEALRKIPGVNVRDEEGFGLRPNIGIRGTNPTRSTKVLLLEDGIPLAYAPYGDNASYYHPPIERFKSIEVMKGSSQIAYGPQTIAGVINYVTPNPTAKPTFELSLTGGNRSYFNGSATGSGTIGRTGIFANYTRKQGNGTRDNTNSKLSDLSTKVVQTLNDRNALTFKFSYYGEDSNVTYSGLTADEYAADPRANPFKNDFFYGDRYGFAASHAFVFSPRAALTTNAYFSHFKRHWWRQSSNSGQRPNRLNVDPDCRSMADLNTTCGNEGRLREYDTAGVEPRFTLDYGAGSRFHGELQVGFRLHWEDQFRRQLNGDLPNSRDGVPAEINKRRNFARSGYIQNRFIFGHLAITPGLRIEHISIERKNLLASPVTAGRTTVTAVIPGLGIAYSGLPRTTLFAGIHKGFSPPRAEDIIGNNGGVIDLAPEESWNTEVGVRSTPLRGLRLEGAFFRLDYENQIVPASLAGGVGALLTNGGRTLHQGAEFSALVESGTIFPSRHNFYLRSAVTWLPVAEFRGTRFSSITPTVLVNGNRLPYAPQTLATNSIGYSHPLGLDMFVENVFTSGQFSDDLNTVDVTPNGQRGYIPSQNYWNATVNYSIESLRSTLFVTAKNLSDRTLVVDRSRGILPFMGRSVHAGVKIRFR